LRVSAPFRGINTENIALLTSFVNNCIIKKIFEVRKMKRKTVEEREADLKDLREQIKKMQNKAKEMAKRNKVQERKERTKRLIEIGAVVESVYGKGIEKELLPYLEKFLEGQNERGNYFTKALEEGRKILGLDEKKKSETEEKVVDAQAENKTETGKVTAQNIETDVGNDEIEKVVE